MSKKEKYDIEKELREWFRGAGRVVVVGVGNPIRMDDFVGVKIVRDLRGKANSEKVMLIEAETIPENHMQQIIDYKPTHILIIDAAIIGLKPGQSQLISAKELANLPAFSTHILPLRIFCDYITEAIHPDLALLLIQPKKTAFGESLSNEAINSIKDTVSILLKVLARINLVCNK